jgi:hypothetical protein
MNAGGLNNIRWTWRLAKKEGRKRLLLYFMSVESEECFYKGSEENQLHKK